MTSDDLQSLWHNPPREHGAMPLWFWNDDLTEEELLRQIREFHAKGFMGFTPHARTGLSRRVGYLTDEFFRLLRLSVDEAARLGMKVAITDEGSYPSGAAQGRVVAENPAYAQRCLIALHHTIAGPAAGYWRPNPGRALGDKLVCVVAAREIAPDVLDPDTLTILPHDENELVRYNLPAGDWRLVACWNVFSGSTIRGVFEEEEDRHATAPAAADILNPDAVACFIRHTHDRIYEHLKEHFGKTFIAIFTDEPGPLSRHPRRGPDPQEYTDGLLDDLRQQWTRDDGHGDLRRWLPALWLDCGAGTAAFRDAWKRAVADRLDRVFYEPQSKWCRAHGIALTGHPQWSNELAGMRHLTWPGQDMVWRYVTPERPASAIEGPNSVAAKSATSMAAITGARYTSMETLGAYGWRLTLDEVKWLLDWHLVRGNNLYFLHACFYSIRGRRKFESEPDIGVHNPWWPYFGILGDYLRRLCWMITDGTLACDVAILSDPTSLAWEAARELQQSQIDYLYVDEQAIDDATISDARLICSAGQQFRAIVLDRPAALSEATRAKLAAFRAAGGLVIDAATTAPDAGASVAQAIADHAGRDVQFTGDGGADLRALHYRKAGREFYFFVNEGEQPIDGNVALRATGAAERWDALDGSSRPWPAGRADDGRTHLPLRLERRESAVICLDPARRPPVSDVDVPPVPGEVVLSLDGPWTAHDDASGRPLDDLACPGDWSRQQTWETFAGTVCFHTSFDLPVDLATAAGTPLFLDLGVVGDIAEVHVNGVAVGLRAWGLHVLEITRRLRTGRNDLAIRVTNSIANRLDGLQRPSGLIGPVCLRTRRVVSSGAS